MKSVLKHRFHAAVVTVAAVIATTAFTFGSGGSSFADPPGPASGPIVWTGNGTTNGMCGGSEDLGLTVPSGQQAWLFILTSPGTGPFALTTNLGNATGTEEGDGSVHFILFTSLNAVLTSASAVNGMTNSILTVSGCQFGASASTTTTTTTTTPTTTTTTTGDTGTPSTGGTTGTSTGGGTAGVSTSASSVSPGPTSSSPFTSPAESTAAPAGHSGIAFTGANLWEMLLVGLSLLGAGSVLVLTARKRWSRRGA